MRIPTHKTRTVDDIGEAVKDRLQEQIILFRVILEISILNYDETSCSSLYSGMERRPLAPLLTLCLE